MVITRYGMKVYIKLGWSRVEEITRFGLGSVIDREYRDIVMGDGIIAFVPLTRKISNLV